MPRYTPDQLARRNASVWTTVQAILAPIQFVMFLAGLTVTYLYQYGIGIESFAWVTFFVALKTFMLVLIFVTGGFFEREVFGKFAFAPEFFWEDFGSSIAMVVHIAYFVLFFMGIGRNHPYLDCSWCIPELSHQCCPVRHPASP